MAKCALPFLLLRNWGKDTRKVALCNCKHCTSFKQVGANFGIWAFSVSTLSQAALPRKARCCALLSKALLCKAGQCEIIARAASSCRRLFLPVYTIGHAIVCGPSRSCHPACHMCGRELHISGRPNSYSSICGDTVCCGVHLFGLDRLAVLQLVKRGSALWSHL